MRLRRVLRADDVHDLHFGFLVSNYSAAVELIIRSTSRSTRGLYESIIEMRFSFINN
jgi:hypothetical protein